MILIMINYVFTFSLFQFFLSTYLFNLKNSAFYSKKKSSLFLFVVVQRYLFSKFDLSIRRMKKQTLFFFLSNRINEIHAKTRKKVRT